MVVARLIDSSLIGLYIAGWLFTRWFAKGTSWRATGKRIVQELNPFMLPAFGFQLWTSWQHDGIWMRAVDVWTFCFWGWNVLHADDDDDDPWRRRGRRLARWARTRTARRQLAVNPR